MTVELITGFAGTPHIGSDDIGAFQAGIVGPGDYALATGNQLRATMSNANTIAVQSGDAVLNGRHVHLTGTTTATVQSGTQGQKRNDLVVLRYTKNTTTGVETCSIVVLKGTPTTGTPADPAHNTGSILDGVATHDMPLYRIPINGITVGTLVPLFNVLKPMTDVWDSLTPTRYTFSNPERSQVIGRVQDRDRIVRISGMTVLGSGTLCPIPFLHPQYPMRAVSVSIAASGDINILYGDEVTLTSGYLDVYTDAG